MHRNSPIWGNTTLIKHPKRTTPWWSRLPDPAAWLFQISQYPHGSIFSRGWPRALSQIFFHYVYRRRKKIFGKLIDIILYFYILLTPSPPKQWHSPSLVLPPLLNLFPCTPSVAPACFWLVVVPICCLAAASGHNIFYFILFIYLLLNLLPEIMGKHPPYTFQPSHSIAPTSKLLLMPTVGWLLCPPPSNSSHQRPRVCPFLYFLMWLKNLYQSREQTFASTNTAPGAWNGFMGRHGAKIWGRRCPTHGERGQSYWGVEWQLILLVVVCCVVLCVVVWAFS